jgi:hypothetical protein
MSDILITYRATPAALVGIGRFSFLGDVRYLPPGHPVVRMATYMAYYAQLLLGGQMPEKYTDDDAERFARFALINPDQLARRHGDSDEALAARFGVPADEVARAREELAHGR